MTEAQRGVGSLVAFRKRSRVRGVPGGIWGVCLSGGRKCGLCLSTYLRRGKELSGIVSLLITSLYDLYLIDCYIVLH